MIVSISIRVANSIYSTDSYILCTEQSQLTDYIAIHVSYNYGDTAIKIGLFTLQ